MAWVRGIPPEETGWYWVRAVDEHQIPICPGRPMFLFGTADPIARFSKEDPHHPEFWQGWRWSEPMVEPEMCIGCRSPYPIVDGSFCHQCVKDGEDRYK